MEVGDPSGARSGLCGCGPPKKIKVKVMEHNLGVEENVVVDDGAEHVAQPS